MSSSVATAEKTLSEKGSKKPVFTHHSGSVWASVFPREVSRKDGKSLKRYSTSIQKSYKDRESGDWKYTSNFDEEDLFDVHVASQKAYEFIRAEKGGQADK